jgi:hypothetical protein
MDRIVLDSLSENESDDTYNNEYTKVANYSGKWDITRQQVSIIWVLDRDQR